VYFLTNLIEFVRVIVCL